jgi:hypothetical protein
VAQVDLDTLMFYTRFSGVRPVWLPTSKVSFCTCMNDSFTVVEDN